MSNCLASISICSLSYNNIGPAGVQALREGLKFCVNLQGL